MREDEDITKDREAFAKDLKNALERRLSNVQKDETLAVLEFSDAQTLVKLQCGEVSAGKIHYNIPEGEIEDSGIHECEQLLSVIQLRSSNGTSKSHKRGCDMGYGNSFVLNGLYSLMMVIH